MTGFDLPRGFVWVTKKVTFLHFFVYKRKCKLKLFLKEPQLFNSTRQTDFPMWIERDK